MDFAMSNATLSRLEEKLAELEARLAAVERSESARPLYDPGALRVGYGNDLHRLTEGPSLRLGGVTIPCGYSLLGYSDADALLHAISDAVLGAAGLGDIGELFPDTESENQGRDSAGILSFCAEEAARAGWRVVNVDCVVCAQRPKLGPLKKTIRARIASILDLPPDCVNVKAKTGEYVGPVGRMEAIEAHAVALLAPISDQSSQEGSDDV
jgi:2-C-methyl-D-erythritol 2,4-cyclodiphosphate synthase